MVKFILVLQMFAQLLCKLYLYIFIYYYNYIVNQPWTDIVQYVQQIVKTAYRLHGVGFCFMNDVNEASQREQKWEGMPVCTKISVWMIIQLNVYRMQEFFP